VYDMTDHATATHPAYPIPRTGCPMDLPPLLGDLREERPVSRVTLWDGSRPWLITRHAEAREALRDSRLSADMQRPGFPFVSRAMAESQKSGAKVSFIRMDPPEHDRQRRMLTQEFMIKRMAAMRPDVDRVVDALLDDMVAAGPPADLVQSFALPLPSLVICRLLGVPYEDHAFFQECSRVMIDQTSEPDAVRAARERLQAYLDRLVSDKAVRPADDLLSRLVADQELPGHLPHDEVVSMALLLLVAGHETTANMTALSVLNLLRNPDQLALLRERPELLPGAVEELLRHQTIVQTGVARVAVEDLDIGGTTVRAGEGVLVSIAAANRDARAFPDPENLDVTRPDGRRHVSFGFGVHQCLGQPLARVELQSALAGIIRRLPGLRVTEPLEELDFRHRMSVYGLFALPVEW
jgi:cytochrome P450